MERFEGNSIAANGPGSRAPSFNCDEGDKFFNRMKSRDFGSGAAAITGKSEVSGKNCYSPEAQIPFDWEAVPGKPKKEEERSLRPPPLSPPPMMMSPSVSRTPSFASDKWRTTSIRVPSKQNSQNAAQLNGKLSNMQSFNKVAQSPKVGPSTENNFDQNSRSKRAKSKPRDDRDEVYKSSCNPFSLRRSRCWRA